MFRPAYHLALTLVLCLLTVPATAQRPARQEASWPPGVGTLTEAQLRNYLTFIASDELQGRATPSPGLDIAARFLASQLERWGYEPAGDAGSFFQSIALTRHVLDTEQTTLAIDKQTLTLGEQYLPSSAASGSVSGPLVYAGHGYTVKSKSIDPWGDLDVRGKIVLLHPGLPTGLRRSDLKGPQGEDWNDGAGAAAERGAVAVLYLADYRALESWPRTKARLTAAGSLAVDAFASAPNAATLPSAVLAPSAYGVLFADEPITAADMHTRLTTRQPADAFALSPAKRVAFTVVTTSTSVTTRNVVAVLRGSDTSLRNEYVALGAHYDHLGVVTGTAGAAATDDKVYNGADDDGSGTAGLLGIAEAFAKAPTRPKRSLLFVWHTGEEIGLWGSRYFSEFPTVPLDRIVTQINVDMIGRSRAEGDTNPANATLTGPDAVYVIGSRLMSTQLGRLVDEVNARFLKLSYDYAYADPNDPERFFYRSDHYHYAKHGIPVVFYFSGVHEDYHGVDDEVEKIDFRKMTRIAQSIYATAWELAERPKRPVVDTPLARELLTR